MFQAIHIPEISPTAGIADDGVIFGTIPQTVITSVQSSVANAAVLYALALNANPNFAFTDISTAMGDDTVDDASPFGTAGTFTTDDAFYIACNDDVAEIYVRVSTPGVWTGTGLAIFDSTDGVQASRQMTGVVDASNGFRAAAGIYRISWTAPASARVAFSPMPGHIASRKWLVIKPVGFTAVTTAPKLTRVWLRHPETEVTHSDFTAIGNGAMTDSAFGALEFLNVFVADNASLYACFSGPTLGLDVAIYRRTAGGITYAWEYLATDTTWKPLTGISDPSDGYQNGPVAFSTTPTLAAIRWPIPTDWASTAHTLPPQAAVTGFWIRRRVVTVTAPGPYPTVLLRARSKTVSPSTATGVLHRADRNYQRVMVLRCGVPPVAVPLIGQIVNVNTGLSASFTVPVGTDGPVEIATSNALQMQAGQQALIMGVSGAAQDILLDIRE